MHIHRYSQTSLASLSARIRQNNPNNPNNNPRNNPRNHPNDPNDPNDPGQEEQGAGSELAIFDRSRFKREKECQEFCELLMVSIGLLRAILWEVIIILGCY